MNTPSGPYDDPEFEQAVSGYHDSPYGTPTIPADSIPHKPGLTKRGKVVLAAGTAILATGGMFTWQHYQAAEKASEAQAQEIQYKRDLLALEMQKELNQAATQNQKTQTVQNTARQKKIDACVADNKGLIGKQLGATMASVVSDCQAQYPATGDSQDAMQEAASTSNTNSGGGISPGMLLGLAAGGGLLVAYAANRGRRANAA